jgi:lipoprotein-anchoring transpeptidase ErfK/SrfK
MAASIVSPILAAGNDEQPPPIAAESATPGSAPRRSATQAPTETESHSVDAPRPDSAVGNLVPPTSRAEAWSGIQIVVYKSERRLAVYRGGVFESELPVVLGLAPKGRKRHANDARTPEGLYRVVGKRRHDKWQHFLALGYPNASDRERYHADLRRGTIPDDRGVPFGIGGDIGIHGNDREADQAAGVDWTKGCVALSAADIEKLNELVPVGTPVWIVE